MIGTNVLSLNKATMMQAVAYYLNEVQYKKAVKVTNVSEDGPNHEFKITIISPEEDVKL